MMSDECYYCKEFYIATKHEVRHINVALEPPIKYFCSQKCKEMWMARMRAKNKDNLQLTKIKQ